MMKFLNSIYIMLLSLLVVSCEQDPLYLSADGSDEVLLNLGITTKATEDDNALGEAECAIETLRVYAFDSSGKFDRMEYFAAPTHDNVYEMVVTQSSNKTLYFLVNEPVGLKDELDGITTASALEAVDFEIAAAMNQGFNGDATFTTDDFITPMSKIETGVDASGDKSLTVTVDRVVARVDLWISKDANAETNNVQLVDGVTTFEIDGVYDQVYYMDGNVGDGADLETRDVNSADHTITSENQRVLSFYVAERAYSVTKSPITIAVNNFMVDGKYYKDTITLGDLEDGASSEITDIERNTIYRINAVYKGEEAAVKGENYVIMPWNKVDVDGDMGGVILAVQRYVGMDWFRNNYSYDYKGIAFGGDRDIEIYLPVSRNDDGTFEYSETAITADDDNLLNNPESTYDENVAKWLTSASVDYTSGAKSGFFDFTYKLMDVTVENEVFPIRIKSENVIKTMYVVYDNGYISQDHIPVVPVEPVAPPVQTWEGDAPVKPVFSDYVSDDDIPSVYGVTVTTASYFEAYEKWCKGEGDDPGTFKEYNINNTWVSETELIFINDYTKYLDTQYDDDTSNDDMLVPVGYINWDTSCVTDYLSYYLSMLESNEIPKTFEEYAGSQVTIDNKAYVDSYTAYLDKYIGYYNASTAYKSYEMYQDYLVAKNEYDTVIYPAYEKALAAFNEKNKELNDLGINLDWSANITHGFVVAKRGEALHPAETAEIFFANDEGRYDGEYSMSGHEAQEYCKRLGPDWYLPSADMLRMVQLKGTELGTSYRFQNTDGAMYWSSTPAGNSAYMAVSMSKGADVEPESRPASTNLYVRCMLNL